jgi:hypothetical protein
LLKIAIGAHGGLNAWNQFESLRESVSIGGTGAGREGRTPLKTMIAVFGFLSL